MSVVNFLLIKGVNLVSASSHSFGLVLTQSKPTCCILQLWILTEKGPPKKACEQGYTIVNTGKSGAPCLSLSQPSIPFQDSLVASSQKTTDFSARTSCAANLSDSAK